MPTNRRCLGLCLALSMASLLWLRTIPAKASISDFEMQHSDLPWESVYVLDSLHQHLKNQDRSERLELITSATTRVTRSLLDTFFGLLKRGSALFFHRYLAAVSIYNVSSYRFLQHHVGDSIPISDVSLDQSFEPFLKMVKFSMSRSKGLSTSGSKPTKGAVRLVQEDLLPFNPTMERFSKLTCKVLEDPNLVATAFRLAFLQLLQARDYLDRIIFLDPSVTFKHRDLQEIISAQLARFANGVGHAPVPEMRPAQMSNMIIVATLVLALPGKLVAPMIAKDVDVLQIRKQLMHELANLRTGEMELEQFDFRKVFNYFAALQLGNPDLLIRLSRLS